MKLSDIEVHDRLCAASEALGEEDGETIHADTALKAARKALMLFQLSLVRVMEKHGN